MSPPPPTHRLTADLLGVGGVIKQRHDDFQVEELPLYEPSGQGEHLMLLVEKRGRTTQEAIKRIADAFRVGKRDIGYAGLKDKHALTRQHLTVHLPGKTEDGELIGQALERCEALRDIDVLWATPHANKLKRGHLAANQFTIFIRDVGVTAAIRAKPILDRLAATGIPNYYGPQRFGFRRNAHALGRLLLLNQHHAFIEEMLARPGDDDDPRLADARARFRQGDLSAAIDAWPRALPYDRQLLDALRKQKPADQAVAAISREHRDFLLSAAQSAAFNRVVAQRLADGTLNQLLVGDLAFLHDRGAVFAVDQPTADTDNAPEGRVAQLAVSPSGPMWGPGMTLPTDQPLALEQQAAQAEGITPDQWLAGPADRSLHVEGARRPLRIPLRDASLAGGSDDHGLYLRLKFTLPKGAFATIVCDEIMKAN